MQKIIPLVYKIKLWKSCLSEDKIKRYSDPNYFKNRLEDEFRLSEHIEDPKKIFLKKYVQKEISLEEPIDVEEFNKRHFIFAKFKYGDKVAENDNGKVCHEGEIIQVLSNKGSLLTDFYFGMDFAMREDSKFFILEGTITTIQKSNEQMKAQIYNLLKNDLYIQDNKDKFPEYILDFKFEEQEISSISEKVKSLELVAEVEQESKFDQAEKGSQLKKFSININVGGGIQDKIITSMRESLSNITGIKKITKRAVVKQGKSILRSNYTSDGLKLALKDSFLYSDDNITFDKFKNETYKHIFPDIDFED